ncbi:serine--tRNA ligase [Candidatus Saccharibacteria bacterium]|nr:serine--tRNA ligase [Candidatus Saccharibacteria bacterium]
MLDIRFIRENAELVAEKSKQKGYEVDIPKLLELDKRRREMLADIETVRAQRNELAEQAKGQKPLPEMVEKGKHLKDHLTDCEARLKPLEEEFEKQLNAVPNVPSDDVPVGASEAENVVTKEWGEKPKFDFEPKTHWQIAESRGLIDKERAAKVAGSRFAYIKGDLVKLQFAIIQFGLDVLTSQETVKKIIQDAGLDIVSKAFVPVLPPAVARTEVYQATGRLNKEEQTYKLEDDDLWLNASAEHTLAPMYLNEILDDSEMPLRYVGYTTAFRREAGTYGKDMEGIIRQHQFDKLEMESFTKPEDGLKEHHFMVAVQEYLMQQLKLPYQLLNKCTADIGFPNARGMDINTWLPGQNKYVETHTADFITDFQARGMNTRVKTTEGTKLVHTNDATAFAMGRTMVAIIENYQIADGNIKIPEVLRPYMGNQETI